MLNFNKPAGYDDVQAGGDFTPIELGGHKLVIKKIEDVSNGVGSYLKVMYDTAPDDIQPNYFADKYKNDTRDTKKWGGVINIFPTDRDGRASKKFKQFCTSIERSNNSQIEWGSKFEQSIVGKVVGGVFGEEEYLDVANNVKTVRKLFWFRSVDGIQDAKVPNKRTLEGPDTNAPDGFVNIPEGIDEQLPF